MRATLFLDHAVSLELGPVTATLFLIPRPNRRELEWRSGPPARGDHGGRNAQAGCSKDRCLPPPPTSVWVAGGRSPASVPRTTPWSGCGGKWALRRAAGTLPQSAYPVFQGVPTANYLNHDYISYCQKSYVISVLLILFETGCMEGWERGVF